MWQDIDTFLPLVSGQPLAERGATTSTEFAGQNLARSTEFETYHNTSREHMHYYHLQQQQHTNLHQGYYNSHKTGELDLRLTSSSVKCEPDSSTLNQGNTLHRTSDEQQNCSNLTKDVSEISSSTEERDIVTSCEKRLLMSPHSPMSYLQNSEEEYPNRNCAYSLYQQPLRANNNDITSKECYQVKINKQFCVSSSKCVLPLLIFKAIMIENNFKLSAFERLNYITLGGISNNKK